LALDSLGNLAQRQASNRAPSPGVRSLSAKERVVLEFIETFIDRDGLSPSYQEIKEHFAFASFNSVQNYLKQLASKGYLVVHPHQKRAIQLLLPSNSFSTTRSSRAQLLQAHEEILSIPLLGAVAAGQPIEKLCFGEEIQVPPSLVKAPGETFALKVSGLSMIEEGILDGDVILVQKTKSVQNGDLIVAIIENEATVKRFFTHPRNSRFRRIELRPANAQMESLWYSEEKVEIEGRVVSLMRKFWS
jgi:repressor LexA